MLHSLLIRIVTRSRISHWTGNVRNAYSSYSILRTGIVLLKVVYEAMKTACKCHGVSGSCTTKTCWKSLPDMRTVSSSLLQRYTQAVHVHPIRMKQRTLQGTSLVPVAAGRTPLRSDELAFYTISPDYCLPDTLLGSVGTQHRYGVL